MPVDPAIPVVHGKTDNRLRGKSLLYSVTVFLSIGVWLFGCVPIIVTECCGMLMLATGMIRGEPEGDMELGRMLTLAFQKQSHVG